MKIKDKTGVRYCREYTREVMAEAVPIEGRAGRGNRGFTLIELLLVTLLLGILVTLAIPNFTHFKNTAKISRCAEEIRGIEKVISAYQADQGVLPVDLSVVKQDTVKDPWGNAYIYLKIGNPSPPPQYDGHFADVLNTDFDLYSMGADGASTQTLAFPIETSCQDDVVRAGNGAWVGLATAF